MTIPSCSPIWHLSWPFCWNQSRSITTSQETWLNRYFLTFQIIRFWIFLLGLIFLPLSFIGGSMVFSYNFLRLWVYVWWLAALLFPVVLLLTLSTMKLELCDDFFPDLIFDNIYIIRKKDGLWDYSHWMRGLDWVLEIVTIQGQYHSTL